MRTIRARVGAEVVATKQTARDLVTAVDGEVQEAIRAALLGQYPSHAFLGEEGFEAGALEAAGTPLAAFEVRAAGDGER